MILKKTGESDINLKYVNRDTAAISSILLKHGQGSSVKKFS